MAACGTCRHWRRGENQNQIVGQTVIGECRHSPPQMVVVQGPQGYQFMTQYPPVHEQFEICSRYEARDASG